MTSQAERSEKLLEMCQELSVQEFWDVVAAVSSRLERDDGQSFALFVAHWSPRDSELLDAAASLAARHSALDGSEARLRGFLALMTLHSDLAKKLGGDPRTVLDGFERTALDRARLQGETMRAIWDEPMLTPGSAALALGAKQANRERVRQYRMRSWLLGLSSGRGFMYPVFQFDTERRDVHAAVRAVNERLDAAGDPWGVASWWFSRHDRLGVRPAELVGTDRADDLATVAGAVTEPVG